MFNTCQRFLLESTKRKTHKTITGYIHYLIHSTACQQSFLLWTALQWFTWLLLGAVCPLEMVLSEGDKNHTEQGMCSPDLEAPHEFMLSCFGRVWLCVTLWTVAQKAPPSTGFSRQEYWSGLLFPLLPNPEIEPASLMSPALARGFFFLTLGAPESQHGGGGGLVTKPCPTLEILGYS